VWFNEVARTEQAITGDAAALMAALERIQNREFTRIDLGLIEAQRAVTASADAIRVPTLVLLTDGRSNPVPPALAVAAAEAARAEGTAIYAIGLGPDVDVETLGAITGSPARLFLAPSSADLEAIYAQIAARLACADPPP
jgi:Mg-chelatase subunit ChlD